MSFKHKIYYGLAAVHFVMIVLFATHFTDWGNIENKSTRVLSAIGNYTGSNNIFSFFAPGLSDQPYVVYTIQDEEGREMIIDLKGTSPDFANRVNNIYGYLTLKETRSVLSASLAQTIFKRYPHARKIRVAMVVQQIPTMREYRRGERNRWQFWFHRDFSIDTTLLASKNKAS